MSIWNAVLLGLVQGIAEFLPISSSGHLSIVNNLFKMSNDGHMFFDVLLHLGTFISILIVYWQDLKEMVFEVLSFVNVGPLAGQPREHYPMARMFLMIVVATLPLFLVLPINDQLETLYYSNVFIGIAIILTGCMLYVADRMKPGKKTEIIRFPASLQEDLLRYAADNGRTTGMIFTKKNGTPIERTQVSLYIQKLAQAAQVPAEKGNIRALRQLYKSTVSSIEANFDLLVRQAYERQLETEQLSVGWE